MCRSYQKNMPLPQPENVTWIRRYWLAVNGFPPYKIFGHIFGPAAKRKGPLWKSPNYLHNCRKHIMNCASFHKLSFAVHLRLYRAYDFLPFFCQKYAAEYAAYFRCIPFNDIISHECDFYNSSNKRKWNNAGSSIAAMQAIA